MNYLLTLLVTVQEQTKLVDRGGFAYICREAEGVAAKLNDEFTGAYPNNSFTPNEISAQLTAGRGVAAFRMGPKIVGVVTEVVERPQ